MNLPLGRGRSELVAGELTVQGALQGFEPAALVVLLPALQARADYCSLALQARADYCSLALQAKADYCSLALQVRAGYCSLAPLGERVGVRG